MGGDSRHRGASIAEDKGPSSEVQGEVDPKGDRSPLGGEGQPGGAGWESSTGWGSGYLQTRVTETKILSVANTRYLGCQSQPLGATRS